MPQNEDKNKTTQDGRRRTQTTEEQERQTVSPGQAQQKKDGTQKTGGNTVDPTEAIPKGKSRTAQESYEQSARRTEPPAQQQERRNTRQQPNDRGFDRTEAFAPPKRESTPNPNDKNPDGHTTKYEQIQGKKGPLSAEELTQGDVLRFSKPLASRNGYEPGFSAGEAARVQSVDPRSKEVTLIKEDGRATTFNLEELKNVDFYRETSRTFHDNQRIEFPTAGSHDKTATSQRGTIQTIPQRDEIERNQVKDRSYEGNFHAR